MEKSSLADNIPLSDIAQSESEMNTATTTTTDIAAPTRPHDHYLDDTAAEVSELVKTENGPSDLAEAKPATTTTNNGSTKATAPPSFRQLLWQEWIKPFLVVAFVVFSIRSTFIDWYVVPSGSMKPSILVGDRVLVWKAAYGCRIPGTTAPFWRWGEPKRGDIVVFWHPDRKIRFIKRIIGVPGDQLELVGNRLILNGQPTQYEPLNRTLVSGLSESDRDSHAFANEHLDNTKHAIMLTSHTLGHDFGPVEVPPNCYFMLGDNRDASGDSRVFGFVQRDWILGKASRTLFSIDPDQGLRSGRWGLVLQ